MPRTGKKADVKPAEKKKPEVKSPEKISLIVFKEITGMPNITYNGFKASLGAEDSAKYTQTELEKEFKKYQAKKAFIKK